MALLEGLTGRGRPELKTGDFNNLLLLLRENHRQSNAFGMLLRRTEVDHSARVNALLTLSSQNRGLEIRANVLGSCDGQPRRRSELEVFHSSATTHISRDASRFRSAVINI